MTTRLRMTQVAGMNLHYVFFPLMHFLDSMVQLGIENIELWGGLPHIYVEDAGLADIRCIAKSIEDHELRLICYTPEQCTYPVNIAAAEDDVRRRSLRYFLRNLDVAAELGAGRMLITSGRGYLTQAATEAWQRSRESLAALAEEAQRLGIELVLEPLQPKESNLVIDIPTLLRMINDVSAPNMTCCLDTIPMVVAGESIDQYFSRVGDGLVHIHFNDGNPTGHLACGDGTLPMRDYLDQIGRHGYQGFLTLEIANAGDFLRPDDATSRAVEKVRSFLA